MPEIKEVEHSNETITSDSSSIMSRKQSDVDAVDLVRNLQGLKLDPSPSRLMPRNIYSSDGGKKAQVS